MAVEDQFQQPSAFEADEAAPTASPDLVIDGFRLIDGDIRDVSATASAIRGADAVILLASLIIL